MKILVTMAVQFLLVTGTTSGTSIKKRSDDTNPLTAVVQQLSAEVAQLKAGLSAHDARLVSLEHRVAFRAQFSAGTLIAPTSGPFKFDRVIFNDGKAYDPILGIFTAPYQGVYLFTFQIFTHVSERLLIDIKINGNVLTRMSTATAQANPEESAVTSVLVKLLQGDRVWVESAGNEGTADIFGGPHSYFYGALQYTI